jgi:uncharacterized protein (DUF433 family)
MQLTDYFDFLDPDDIRIKGHRIGIDNVLFLYRDGYSAEEIAEFYPTLSLEKIYATLTYYHHNRAELDAYLTRLEAWREQRRHAANTQAPTPAMERVRKQQELRHKEMLSRS